MDINRYKSYLVNRYENRIFRSIKTTVETKIEYDAANNFVFVRMARKMAIKCKDIMRKEWFLDRYQIFKNLQAGRIYCHPWCPP